MKTTGADTPGRRETVVSEAIFNQLLVLLSLLGSRCVKFEETKKEKAREAHRSEGV